MSDILQKAIEYVRTYVRNNYTLPHPAEDRDMYDDEWVDNFSQATHNFQVDTTSELVEMMNYCNKYNEYSDFRGINTVQSITSDFLSTVLVEEKLMS
jgi:hypothetical protein